MKQGWEIAGDVMKSKPRGFADDHPHLDLLKHRSIYARKVWGPDDVLHEPACLDRVRKSWRQLKDFNAWCEDHVGVSDYQVSQPSPMPSTSTSASSTSPPR